MRSNIRAGIAAAVLILGITTACVPTKSPAPSALAGRTIVIDPGHHGQNWAHPDEINTPVWIGTQ